MLSPGMRPMTAAFSVATQRREGHALIFFDRGAKQHPYRRSDEAKCAEHEESRCEANPLRDPATKSRAECRAGTLNRDDGALREIDPTASIERARDHPW